MPGAAISIEGLSKRYRDFVAVDDVSLDIASGEFVTLLGLSGSGKTTTLMAIAGFVDLDAGRIAIDGRDLVGLPPEKRGLGVVFQNYALFPHLNVYDNVAFPLRMRRWEKGRIRTAVARVLEIVGLAAFADRRIAALSGGQQQRVALARALVFEPPVLLMDEPLGALDRSMRDQLQTEIKRIQRELAVTVVYVTHDQEEALALSDRIAVMADGRIRQIGTPDEIYERPNSSFVAGFVGESNRVAVRVLEIAGGLARVRVEGSDGADLLAVAADDLSPGPGVLMLRPEAVRLHDTRPGGPNSLPATVETREFLGASLRLALSTPIGPIVVRKSRLGADAGHGLGTRLSVSFRPEDALAFPAP